MNLYKYKKICKICNSIILKNFKNNSTILAINILSIVKEHPVFYQKLYKKLKTNFFILFFEIIINFLKLFSIFILSFIFFTNKKKIQNKKIIFLSHSFKKEKEFYFSPLIKNLDKKKYFLICIKHDSNYIKYFCSNFGNFIVLNFSQKIIIILKILNLFFFLIKKFLFEKKFNKFFLISALEAVSLSTYNNLKITYEINNMIEKSGLDSFVCLFEGLAYERYLIYHLNKKKINVVGLQHTGLSKYQNSLLNLTNSEFYPKKILLKSKREFLIMKKKSPSELLILPANTKKNNKIKKIENIKTKKINILFLIDGELSELDMAIKTCKILKNNNFFNLTLRLHPILKYSSQEKGFKISRNTLEKDIRDNQIVLFRSSTSVITAVENGLYPIFLNYGNLISNPLQYINIEEINFKKGNINKQLINLINNIKQKKYKKLRLEICKQSLKNKKIEENMII